MNKRFFAFVSLCLLALSSEAKLNIEITQGMVGGVPIAIADKSPEHSFETIAQIVRQDLRMSGRFDPLSPNQFVQLPAAQRAHSAPWQALGAENVVLGTMTPVGGDRFQISYQLLDVYQSAHVGKVMQEKTFPAIRRQDLRQLAHQISDEVYQKLTGIRGAFSTQIAYVQVLDKPKGREYYLEVADADGENPIPLVKSHEPIMSPSWSPDGRFIAFVSFEHHRAEIYLIEVATGQRRLLTQVPGINGAPAWSPDGKTLAVVLSKESNPKIYLMDLATKQTSQLTTGFAIDTEPTWAPNGKALYFTSNRGGKPQIYKVSLGTKKIDRVTFSGSYNARPMITADGKTLVMMHREESGAPFRIASQDFATGRVSVLTHSKLDESPTLSPNGAMVLYGTQEGNKQVLGLVTLDGRGHLRLPAREGSVQEPAWSPFLS